MSQRRELAPIAPGTVVHATVSVQTLAAETDLSPRTIWRTIRELAAKGLLSQPGPDEFYIHLDVLDAMPRLGEPHDA